MDNVFRPSTAFPVMPECNSVLHDMVTDDIAKQLEKMAAEVWAKFSSPLLSKEEQEKTRQAFVSKASKLYPSRYRVIHHFEVAGTRMNKDE